MNKKRINKNRESFEKELQRIRRKPNSLRNKRREKPSFDSGNLTPFLSGKNL